eukprot:1366266-Amphidinium_carterae.2
MIWALSLNSLRTQCSDALAHIMREFAMSALQCRAAVVAGGLPSIVGAQPELDDVCLAGLCGDVLCRVLRSKNEPGHSFACAFVLEDTSASGLRQHDTCHNV